jgi:hypothetical protein
MGVVQEHCCCRPAAHSSCQPDRRTARLTDCSVIPSSWATCFWLPCLPSPPWDARNRSTTRHCAWVRCCTTLPMRRSTAWAFALDTAPSLAWGGTSLPRPMVPDTTDSGTWPAALFASSTALRAATKPLPDPSLGLPPGASWTVPMPIPTYQFPLRSACRAISTTSAACSTTPWSSSPTERSRGAGVSPRNSEISSGTRSTSDELPRWSMVRTYMPQP